MPSVSGARSGLHQERVGVPVVAAFELDDPVASGERARHAHRAHRRFGARADEPHPLHRRHQRPHALAELVLERAWRAEAGAAACAAAAIALIRPARRVAVDQRPPRHHVVDEAVAVDVLSRRAAPRADEQRRAADGLKRANGTVDAAGKDLLARAKRLRACVVRIGMSGVVRMQRRPPNSAAMQTARACPRRSR